MSAELHDLIDQRLALLEKWEHFFANAADPQAVDYSGALYQCHNERYFLTQLKKEVILNG